MTENQNKTIEVPWELFNGIANYLGGRPYIEVAPLIQAMQATVSGKVSAKTEDKPEKR